MICQTDCDGTIYPIRFKIIGKDGDHQVYEISRVIKVEEERLVGNRMRRFECEITMNDAPRLCEIKYELDSCKWMLFKI